MTPEALIDFRYVPEQSLEIKGVSSPYGILTPKKLEVEANGYQLPKVVFYEPRNQNVFRASGGILIDPTGERPASLGWTVKPKKCELFRGDSRGLSNFVLKITEDGQVLAEKVKYSLRGFNATYILRHEGRGKLARRILRANFTEPLTCPLFEEGFKEVALFPISLTYCQKGVLVCCDFGRIDLETDKLAVEQFLREESR